MSRHCVNGAPLSGSFDGKGRRIDGLTSTLLDRVDVDGKIVNLHLSGAVDLDDESIEGLAMKENHGTVQNVHVTGTFVLSSHAGMLVGTNDGLVEDCSSMGVITQGGNHVGGLVGFNSGVVRRCWSAVSVTAKKRVGGLVGSHSAPGLIEESYSLGKVTGDVSVGGLLGTLFDGEILNSYAMSEMVTGPLAGGLVGTASSGITNCYAASSLSGDGAQGLVGDGSAGFTATNSYFHDVATGTVGTPLSTEQMQHY